MKKKKKIYLLFRALMTSIVLILIVSCSDSDDKGSYDPSKPVEFKSFSPTEGPTRTELYITGSNFGSDASKIHVKIGGKVAKVIGSNGTTIYCMVPRRAYGGEIEIQIDDEGGNPAVEYQFEKKFKYTPITTVTTLCGYVNELGESSMIDGNYEKAQFDDPFWIEFDKDGEDKILYVCEHGKALRKIDLGREDVSTVVTNGQGSFDIMQTICYSADRDTMFFTDDNGQNTRDMVAISYALRTESFRKVYPYIYDRTTYSVISHPKDAVLFYNTYYNAAVMKANGQYNTEKKEWEPKQLYNVRENQGSQTKMVMHPDGRYAYLMGFNCVQKSVYDKTTQELLRPTVHVGTMSNSGYLDAPGAGARFSYIHQGVFVKNPDYVKEGKDDIYDFYLCDVDNHCIRKITPSGLVETYAGRGSVGLDEHAYGYIDGDLRKEARFYKPSGIAYDEEEEIFYISERGNWDGSVGNRRIRCISVE
ncbi:IPT/TIG domain-containing protein [Prevotella sp. 10(H)]|uniref:IPT/TIG domain-containing protein n=1 Tax=Prevotella sp. 10(H) TaxID=1158294 RepID=UPI0004A71A6B|nr:IPT/TIG domain-containing protein [Prevotella sp. 10(H)]